MTRRRLLWQLYPSFLLITVACLVAIGWFSNRAIQDWYVGEVDRSLYERATLLRFDLLGHVPAEMNADAAVLAEAKDICRRYAFNGENRITLISPNGTVWLDTDEDAAKMENHADRPEVKAALADGTGSSTRYSTTRSRNMRYFAERIEQDGKAIGVLRISIPSNSVEAVLAGLHWKIIFGGVLAATLAAGAIWIMARRIAQPIEAMRRGAERFAAGELRYKLPVPETDEMAGLATSLNQMAAQLEERLSTVIQQRNEREAVLSSMVEGVLAVDADERVISLNRAAAELIGGDEHGVSGKGLQEVVRNAELRRFVQGVLGGQQDSEEEFILRTEPERLVVVRGAALRDDGGRLMGAVIVFNDMTQFRRLETLRRDFVANVSHELRTPIASIKGFAETLLDGALSNPDDTVRFLKIIAKQSDRLIAIIEDLLSLSRIEQSEKQQDLILEVGSVQEVLADTVHDCQPRAAERNITMTLSCPLNLTARINAPLLRQAVGNLLDNAIKYSEPGKTVWVDAEVRGDEAVISVRDQGVGIELAHLERIFERFYRVDKARSRKLGGTGLGLAIVKHIVIAHGGRVSVESTPGVGSTFRITLPLAMAADAA